MNKSPSTNGNKSRSSPSKKATKKRRQRSQKTSTIGGFPVSAIPVAYVSKKNVSMPKIHTDSRKITIVKTEIVTTSLLSSNSPGIFSVLDRLRANPGSQKTFPWLSGIAKNYESYKFIKLAFHYITRCNTVDSEGTFYLSPDYDAADAQPSDEVTVANNVDSREGVPYRNLTCVFKPERMNRLYKAHAIMDDDRFQTTSQDEKTIDCGQLFIAAEVSTANKKIGKLMVEYVVELYEPQQPFVPLSQGGATLTIPNTTITQNTSNIFNSQPSLTGLKNTAGLENLLEILPASSFPGPNFAKVLRDWQGTGVVSASTVPFGAQNINVAPDFKVNGVDVGSDAYGGSFQSQVMGIKGLNLKIGDILGLAQVSSAVAPNLGITLGGLGQLI